MVANVPSERVMIARVPGHAFKRAWARSSPTTQMATVSALAAVAREAITAASAILLALAPVCGSKM